jgi:uncharacterized membrane protein HdeD (DUF308 family)
MILLGALAIAGPATFSMALQVFVGVALLSVAAVQGVVAYRLRDHSAFRGLLALAILFGIAGGVLIAFPIVGIFAITMMVTAALFLDGIAQASFAWLMRPRAGWIIRLVSGIFSLGLAIGLVVTWPTSAAWLVGVFLGAGLISKGIGLLLTARVLRYA